MDTFDLKPEAPAEIRGEFQPIKTNVGGIEIGERVPIPDDLVPPDASVEMEAKKAAG